MVKRPAQEHITMNGINILKKPQLKYDNHHTGRSVLIDDTKLLCIRRGNAMEPETLVTTKSAETNNRELKHRRF